MPDGTIYPNKPINLGGRKISGALTEDSDAGDVLATKEYADTKLNWRNVFVEDSDPAYNVNDLVEFEDALYVCNTNATIGSPTDYPSRWDAWPDATGGATSPTFHSGPDLPETFSDGDLLYWMVQPPDGPPGAYRMQAKIVSGMTGPGGPDIYMWVYDGIGLMGEPAWEQRWPDASTLNSSGIFPLNIPHVASGYGFTWAIEYGFTGTGTMKPVTDENVFYPGTNEGAGAVGNSSSAHAVDVMAGPGSGSDFELNWNFSGGGTFNRVWYRIRPGYFLMNMV